MDHKVGAFCELIEFLHSSHSRWTRDPSADQKQRKLNDEVSRSHKVIEDQKLAQLLREAKKGSVDFLSGGGFLFLKPPEKEGVLLPILSLKSDFSKSELRVRMALFTFDETEEPAAIGFRFETPEGEGRHNYHHAQLIRSFDKHSKDLPKTPTWLPASQPALMMSARTPFSLFLGVLIGLYGLGYLERAWQGQRFPRHLKSDLEELKKGCGAPLN